MTRNRLIALAAVVILAVVAAALVLSRRGGEDSDQAEPAATAAITAAPVKSGVLQDVASVYGVVQADPGASRTLAAPRALIVDEVLARPGEVVGAGAPLAVVESQPTADLAYRQAADAATSAKTDLARVQRLFAAHLAASDQLIQARKAAADADAALTAQQRQGAGRARQTLTAGAPAVVVSVAVAPGDHLAQDAAILVLARQGALSAKLGIEPSTDVAAGDAVTIRPTTGGAPIASRLTMVGRAIDPASHLASAIAPLPGVALPIGAAVQADVVIGSHQGLSAPRDAVVFDETGAHVFVIAGGKAQRVFVTAGRDHGAEIEISGPIKAGQVVAVQGAYELQDGMAVRVAGPEGAGR